MFTSKDLFINLTLRDLRSRYKKSILGWTWSLLNPIATIAIFTYVFANLLQSTPDPGDPSRQKEFVIFLCAGLLPWNFLSAGIMGGVAGFLGNANLVKKTYFPRELLVDSTVAGTFINFLFEMGVYLAATAIILAVSDISSGNLLPIVIPVLFVMLIQAVFVIGLVRMFAVINVYFRDTQYLLGIVLQVWFYATPIVYPPRLAQVKMSENAYRIYKANPMNRFTVVYRDLIYNIRMPSWQQFAYLIVMSFLVYAFGSMIFKKFEPRLAEEL